MSRGVEDMVAVEDAAWLPPPEMLPSEWANAYRYLSSEDSAEPGAYQVERVPFLREPADSIVDPEVREVWFRKSAQVGYSQFLVNMIGYFAHQRPAPMMMLQPTLEMAEAFSKDRISPAVRDSPALRELIVDGSKKGGNTILHKKFPGGHITLAGANSPASLASRPIKIVLIDEPDRYPASAGDEGDPIKLLQKRSTTFWDRGFIAGGTPTVKGRSRIDKGFETGDQRFYHVPCPHCSELISLNFDQLCVDKEEAHYADYKCQLCEQWIDHGHKIAMIADMPMGGRARWIASAESNRVRSYHINELYSPWVTWREMADSYNAAKDDPQMLRVFINTSLGESCEEQGGERLEASELMKKREDYHPQGCPDAIRAVTFGCDTQDDRLEMEIVGWGPGEESWSLDYRTFMGDTEKQEVWNDLDVYLKTVRFARVDGRVLRINAGIIDSGGHRTDEVYKFCRGKSHRKIYPGKGSSTAGKAILANLSRQTKERVMLAMVGTDTAKDQIYARLDMVGSGPGRCHFPMTYDQRYFEMLTGEEKITEWKNAIPYERWIRRRDESGRLLRNEALDCRVYATAALRLVPVNLWALKVDDPAEPDAKEAEKAKEAAAPEPQQDEKLKPKPFRNARKSARKRAWMR